MKVAPIHRAFQVQSTKFKGQSLKDKEQNIKHLICHTGQHYDEKMSKIFFDDLEMPQPDFYLGVGSGSHAEQTAAIMVEFEKVILKEEPELIIVVGDVNSTIACSLVAAKLGTKIAHVEAGLRSFDNRMPEEINRVLTDRISDYLFVTENSGLENLKREGVPEDKIFFVGNVMIDSLVRYLPKIGIKNSELKIKNSEKPYVLITLHRPSNVDDEKFLIRFAETLKLLAEHRKVIFPVHPRTKNNLLQFGLNLEENENIILSEPLGYLEFLSLTKNAELIITDSGGIQEESTYLGVQCITVRENTERPVTVEVGTNQLIGTDLNKVEEAALKILSGEKKKGKIPELWDGRAAERIVEILIA